MHSIERKYCLASGTWKHNQCVEFSLGWVTTPGNKQMPNQIDLINSKFGTATNSNSLLRSNKTYHKSEIESPLKSILVRTRVMHVHLLKDVPSRPSPPCHRICWRCCVYVGLTINCKDAMFVDMSKLVNKGQCLGCQLVLIPRKFCHLKTHEAHSWDSDSF